MYTPAAHKEERLDVLYGLIRHSPLATLISVGADGPEATLAPLLLDTAAAPGCLRGHLARANPHWRTLAGGGPVLALFHGPQAYVSPSWYASKADTGRVVPTWNYAVVEARGTVRVIEDREWLRTQVTALTEQQEAAFAEPWQVADAPAEYIDSLLNAIVGLEITLTQLTGKWKVSQNRGAADRVGVVRGMERSGCPAMAELVRAALPHP